MGYANIIHKANHQMSLENEEMVACVFFFILTVQDCEKNYLFWAADALSHP
jgi:hypothetical protein